MNKIFKYQIKKNIEAYANDMIVKNKMVDTYIADFTKYFKF